MPAMSGMTMPTVTPVSTVSTMTAVTTMSAMSAMPTMPAVASMADMPNMAYMTGMSTVTTHKVFLCIVATLLRIANRGQNKFLDVSWALLHKPRLASLEGWVAHALVLEVCLVRQLREIECEKHKHRQTMSAEAVKKYQHIFALAFLNNVARSQTHPSNDNLTECISLPALGTHW